MSSPPALQLVRLKACGPPSDPFHPDRAREECGFLEGLEALRPDAVHEVFPSAPRQAVAAQGFALGLALRTSARPVVWIVQSTGETEMGEAYGPGLSAWGLDPVDLVLVRVRDMRTLLGAGEDALRSGAAGAVILSGWGGAAAYSLTASRRLMMAAQAGSSLGLLVRAAAPPVPSAAQTRWSVSGVPSVSLEAQAPGRPGFRARLLRSRSGAAPGEWIVEWDRERRDFLAPASGGLAAVSADRSTDAQRRSRAA